MKKIVLLVVLLLTLTACGSAGAVYAGEKEPEWNPRSTWVVYGGELIYPCQQVIGYKPMKFIVEYRTEAGDENGPRYFWLAYVPEDEPQTTVVCLRLLAEHHDLVFNDEGEYRLLVREEALQEAYELWRAFNAEE